MNRFHRKFLICALVAVTATSVLSAFLAPAGAGPRNTDSGEILVVTANVEEGYEMEGGDLKDHFELANFAERIKNVIPEIPDVVLLQEVNHETSFLIARRLTAQLGQKFIVAVRPIRESTQEFPDKKVKTETAIVLNATTMSIADRGGFITTSYPKSASVPGERVSVKNHAFMLATEKATGIKVPLVSVHFAMVKLFKSKALSNYHRGRWAKQIETKMAKKYNANSPERVTMIGGDFNAGRCYTGEFKTCKYADFYKILTSEPRKYTDSFDALGLPAGVDNLFTSGTPLRGNWDEHGSFPERDRARYYSDHRFRWTVMAPKSTS